MCVLGCGDIVRGVHESRLTQVRVFADSPPKSQRYLKVEFAQSRSRFGDYIRWSDITKVM